jgi:hypothetical protein
MAGTSVFPGDANERPITRETEHRSQKIENVKQMKNKSLLEAHDWYGRLQDVK